MVTGFLRRMASRAFGLRGRIRGLYLAARERDSLAAYPLALLLAACGGDTSPRRVDRGDGTDGSEIIVGETELVGRDGDDVLIGTADITAIDGGAGVDTVDYSASDAGVTVTLVDDGSSTGTGGYADGVVLKNIENIIGSDHPDWLVGNSGANVFRGGAGADYLRGLGGSDTLYGDAGDDTLIGASGRDSMDGGEGNDLADYSGSDAGVTVELGEESEGYIVARGGTAEADRLRGFERLTGSDHADALTGNALANELRGGEGDDLLEGGAGEDLLIGGAHAERGDTASYRNSDAGVILDLSSGDTVIGAGGEAEKDELSGIENLLGGGGSDTLTGDVGVNTLFAYGGDDSLAGGDGEDILDGGVGADTLIGGAGIDTLTGGTGRDWFVYRGDDLREADVIRDFQSGIDKLAFSAVDANADLAGMQSFTFIGTRAFSRAGEIRYVSRGGVVTIEMNINADADTEYTIVLEGLSSLSGADFSLLPDSSTGDSVTLIGGPGDNFLRGGAGDDVLEGRGGNDILWGGPGGDDLDGGEGQDTADYSDFDAPVFVDLSLRGTNGYVTAASGHAQGDRLKSIENLIGSSGADVLTGDGEANLLRGGSGADALGGGGGIDTADYSDSAAGVTVAIVQGAFTTGVGGYADGDVLHNMENLIGSDFADKLTGGAGNNVLIGLGGGDTLDGGAGRDQVDYSTSDGIVVLDLSVTDAQGYASGMGGHAAGDLLKGIESIVGSAGADTITGDDQDNVLSGGNGADTLFGKGGADTLIGGAGADFMDGGSGQDAVSYAQSDIAVTIDLANAQGPVIGQGGEAQGDRLEDIEILIGSTADDMLIGDAGQQTLVGGEGADVLIGGAGIDTALYAFAPRAVILDLATTDGEGYAAGGGYADGDRLKGIEVLWGSAYADTLTGGKGEETLIGGEGADRLDGGAGKDTVSYSDSSAAVFIDLQLRGSASRVLGSGGHAERDSLRNVENLRGSAYADSLAGDNGANFLAGGAGDDTLLGRGGADVLDGEGGLDTVDYSAFAAAVTIDMRQEDGAGYIVVNTGSGVGDQDLLRAVENVLGTGGNDRLTGNDIDNLLQGADGADTLAGGAGSDTLDGGAGADLVSYKASISSVFLDLGAIDGQGYTNGQGGHAAGDRIKDVEHLEGSALMADVLYGNAGNNSLSGLGGSDRLEGRDGEDVLMGGDGDDVLAGGSEADRLSGGAHNGGGDTADYSTSGAGIIIELAANGYAIGAGGEADGDLLEEIENIIAGGGDDALTGNSESNALYGGGGADFLRGEGGSDTLVGGFEADTLIGGLGSDTLDGGEGFDSADYSASLGGVTIMLSNLFVLARGGAAEGDLLRGIENLVGSAHADFLIGDAGANVLQGGAGNNRFGGSGGRDFLEGGADEDTVDYGSSSAGVSVDLSAVGVAGYVTGTGGDADGNRLASIEHLIGSVHPDVLVGDSGSNTIIGGTGADTLDGGAGGDVLSYQDSVDGVTVDLSSATDDDGYIVATGSRHAEGDRLRNFETLIGSADADVLIGHILADSLSGAGGDDTLVGKGGSDELLGGPDNDLLIGGLGPDVLIGGAGVDSADYSASDASVTIDLGSAIAAGPVRGMGGEAAGDQLREIENLRGSQYADTLTGDAVANALMGLGGEDSLVGGGGSDVLDGGEGDDVLAGGAGGDNIDGGADQDTVDYGNSRDGVTISLDGAAFSPVGFGGDAAGDRVKNVENLKGSDAADKLRGDNAANTLIGGDADDTLSGAAGDDLLRGGDDVDTLYGGGNDDTLIGGVGNDVLDGGSEATDPADYRDSSANDTVDYRDASGHVIIDLSAPGADGYVTGTVGNVREDRLKGIENLIGSALLTGDTLTGDAGTNRLSGLDGDDTLSGGADTDVLLGGEGDDLLRGGRDADEMNGGEGSEESGDTADYGDSAQGVTVVLDGPRVVIGRSGDAAGDSLTNIENLIGSDRDDTLGGDEERNILDGGGSDRDVADYRGSPAALEIDLSAVGDDASSDDYGYVVGTGGHAEADLLKGFEGIFGSNLADTLSGDSNANLLDGQQGNDLLSGATGRDTLFGGADSDTLIGGADGDLLDGGIRDSTVADTGTDTVEYSESDAGVTLNLAAPQDVDGYVMGFGGHAEEDRLRNMENLIGSSWEDTLIGDTGVNTILGGGGDDWLEGGGQDDRLEGGRENDRLEGGAGKDILKGEEGADILLGDAGEDSLSGAQGADVLEGGEGEDSLSGGDGDDILRGGEGADTLEGGTTGETNGDEADYRESAFGVTISLVSPQDGSEEYFTGAGGDAAGDVLKNVENLRGSRQDDVLIGDSRANVLDGGEGSEETGDRVDYGGSNAGVTLSVVLARPDYFTGAGGYAQGDQLKNIENITGSIYDDVLSGDSGVNRLDGNEGAEQIGDIVDYSASQSRVEISLVRVDDEDGLDFVEFFSGAGGAAEGDRLDNIENLIGAADAADVLIGDDQDNVLEGLGAGAQQGDLLYGLGGSDAASYEHSDAGVNITLNLAAIATGTGGHAEGDRLKSIENLIGSDNDDTLVGDEGDNVLEGLLGSDVLDGRKGSDTASYRRASEGVMIDLGGERDAEGYLIAVSGAHAEGDRLKAIENLIGSETGNDSLTGDAQDNIFEGLGGVDTYDGGDGLDTVSYRFSNGAVTLNLGAELDNAGYISEVLGGHADGDRLKNIERLVGSRFDDTLTGSMRDDVLEGFAGVDELDGGVFSVDEILGDTASYRLSDGGVIIDLAVTDEDGFVSGTGGHAEGDKLRNIENLEGSPMADTLQGDAENNLLRGLAGADVLVGGGGVDTASYQTSDAGVTLDLSIEDSIGNARATGGHAEGDRLRGIQNIEGSAWDDVLTGDLEDNEISGGDGADILIGGAGADRLDGGGGSDTASYESSDGAVSLDLANLDQGYSAGSGGHAEGDSLKSIAHLIGSAYDDTLLGDDSDNTLIGVGGRDFMDGGDGSDTAVYGGSDAGITLNLNLTDRRLAGLGGQAEGDVLLSIEHVVGSQFADNLMAASEANTLEGLGGGDVLDRGTASYRQSNLGVTLLPTADGSVIGTDGHAEGDRLSNIFAVHGSDHDDILRISFGTTLLGFAGDDTLSAPESLDSSLDGGEGRDTASYRDFSQAVSVSLRPLEDLSNVDADGFIVQGGANAGGASGSRLRSIENLTGTSMVDTLVGDDNANVLSGLADADLLSGGGGVNDWVSYETSPAAVMVSLADTQSGPDGQPILATAIGTGGDAEGDRVQSDIENIMGSVHDDTLTGNAADNSLVGLSGADLLAGGGGDGDWVGYEQSPAAVTVDLADTQAGLGGGQPVLGTALGIGGHAEGDQLQSDIENIMGSAHDDVLTGNDVTNILAGGAGRDTLIGGADDLLDGGAGDDTLDGVDADTLAGGAGNDTLNGEGANVLDGGDGNDILRGGAAGSRLIGGAGDDLVQPANLSAESARSVLELSGGDGFDELSYENFGAALLVDLSTKIRSPQVLDALPYAIVMRDGISTPYHYIHSFERITGSEYADTLVGDLDDNEFVGLAGGDRFDGRGGADTAIYRTSPEAVIFDLNATDSGGYATGAGGHAQGDRVRKVENLVGSAYADTLIGDGSENLFAGLGGADVLDGGDDSGDAVSYRDSDDALTLDLAGGIDDSAFLTAVSGGHADGDRLKGIEHVIGTAYDDTITGDQNANTLMGLGGDDSLVGGTEADSIFGGEGSDTTSYSVSLQAVTLTLTDDDSFTGTGGDAEGDVLREIERVIGSPQDDVLTGFVDLMGADGADTLTGSIEDDTLHGGAGADTLDGGAGSDTVNYGDADVGVTLHLADLQDGYVEVVSVGGDAEDDRLKNIENILGSEHDDIFGASSAPNSFTGGDGLDTVDYGASNAPITVSLAADDANTSVQGGYADGDSLVGIERIAGSPFDDRLQGNIENLLLDGAGGSDSLIGSNFVDTLIGGEGGADLADYSSSAGAVTIALNEGAFVTGHGGAAEGDQLKQIEHLIGTDDVDDPDVLTGDAQDNLFEGRNGGDTLIGGGGADTASYRNSDTPVIIDLGSEPDAEGYIVAESADGHAQGDRLKEIENLIGSGGADSLTGNSGVNLFEGLGDMDRIDGAGNVDTASYRSSDAAVTIDLSGIISTGDPATPDEGYVTAASGGHAEGDRLINIENLIGSAFDDTLTAIVGTVQNELRGLAGDDFISVGGGGFADGGEGFDTLSFELFAAGQTGDYSVTVDLTTAGQAGFLIVQGPNIQAEEVGNFEGFIGTAFNDVFTGDGKDNIFEPLAGSRDTVDGGEGVDTISYRSSDDTDPDRDGAVTVNLGGDVDGQGFLMGLLGGHAGGDKLKSIENIIGSKYDDVLTGDDLVNILMGLQGADTLRGGGMDDTLDGGADNDVLIGEGGKDRLDGGSGADAADYSESAESVTVDLLVGTGVGGDAEGDRLHNVEILIGSDAGGNTLRGGFGNDTLISSVVNTRSDVLSGDDGQDTVDYRGSTEAVTIDLSDADDNNDGYTTGVGGGAEGDRLKSIENLVAAFANASDGAVDDNRLFGNGADNTMVSFAGRDTLIGEAGRDTADYSESPVGVTINLARLGADNYVSGSGGYAEGDRLRGIEDIVGSNTHSNVLAGHYFRAANNPSGANRFVGGVAADSFDGGGGVDTLIGGDGNDSLYGNWSADTLFGEEGDDTLVPDNRSGADLSEDILDGGPGVDLASYENTGIGFMVDLSEVDEEDYVTATGGNADGDRLKDIENLVGSRASDTLTGDASTNFLKGVSGDDVINGLGGSDILDGGPGADTLNGDANDDTLIPGEGADTLDGGSDRDLVDYSMSPTGVTISLSLNPAAFTSPEGGHAAFDLLRNVEDLFGSEAGVNTLIGDGLDNHLKGGDANDLLIGGEGADTLIAGDGTDSLIAGVESGSYTESHPDTLDGGDGVDTAIYSASTVGISIDLADQDDADGDGYATGIGGEIDGDKLKNIEILYGADGRPDRIDGNDADNQFFGLRGIDRLGGADGDDTLYGGGGNDTLDGGADNDTLFGGPGEDNLNGGANSDTILDSGETLLGGDTLIGGPGRDILAGGAGDHDWVDYTASPAGVVILLMDSVTDPVTDVVTEMTSVGEGGDAAGDVVNSDIEHIRGSIQQSNNLQGNSKNNTLAGGAEGDLIHGMDGNDTVDYSASPAGVVAALRGDPHGSGRFEYGHAEGDVLHFIDNLIGSNLGDYLAGNQHPNRLRGLRGKDTIQGEAGDDTLYGGRADDTLFGENGDDVLYGGDHADRLDGGANDDVLYGGAGNDRLFGGGGLDTLTGGGGADVFIVPIDNSRGRGDVIIDFDPRGDMDRIDFDRTFTIERTPYDPTDVSSLYSFLTPGVVGPVSAIFNRDHVRWQIVRNEEGEAVDALLLFPTPGGSISHTNVTYAQITLANYFMEAGMGTESTFVTDMVNYADGIMNIASFV